MTKLFGVTGWKNSGKTTLATRLIGEMTARGYIVNSIKHAHHRFDIDQKGTDSFRHREAGAREVAIVSGTRWALMHELRDEAEPSMQAVIARLDPCDLIIVEGYKREPHPKIECRRFAARQGASLAQDDPNIVAVAADHATESHGRPVFDLEDIAGIADFVESYLGLKRPAPAPLGAMS